MNTHDKYELPPLRCKRAGEHYSSTIVVTLEDAEDAIRAAIEADRKQKGVVVVTRTQDGEIVAVTRQDDEGRILSVIAEADRQRRGEPVDIRQEVIETLEMILAADWRKWEELASPDEFVRWAKSRANYALSIINEAPQPAEPVKPLTSRIDFEMWAKSHGDLPLEEWDGRTNHSWAPATYRNNLTEIAWRAWANKPSAAEPVKVPSNAIEELAHRMCLKYSHSSDPDMRQYTFGKLTLHAFARALLARYGHPVGPEGWRMVPVEPTKEMRDVITSGIRHDHMVSVYQAMLEAAPEPPCTL